MSWPTCRWPSPRPICCSRSWTSGPSAPPSSSRPTSRSGSGPRSSPSPACARRWSIASRSTPTSSRPGPTAGASRRPSSAGAGREWLPKRPSDFPDPEPYPPSERGSPRLLRPRSLADSSEDHCWRGVGPSQTITVGPCEVVKPNLANKESKVILAPYPAARERAGPRAGCLGRAPAVPQHHHFLASDDAGKGFHRQVQGRWKGAGTGSAMSPDAFPPSTSGADDATSSALRQPQSGQDREDLAPERTSTALERHPSSLAGRLHLTHRRRGRLILVTAVLGCVALLTALFAFG